jgi:hypothetical protein
MTEKSCYVYRGFLEDCKIHQEIKLFKVLLTNYTGSLGSITNSDFIDLLESNPLIDSFPTFIQDDVLISKIVYNNINNFSTAFFTYDTDDRTDQLAFAIKIKVPVEQEDGVRKQLEDYADNYVYFDMKGFELQCRFTAINNPQYSVKHNHRTDPIDSEHENQLVDILDLNRKIVNKLNETMELISPEDLSQEIFNKNAILPNGRIVGDEEDLLNEDGKDFIDNGKNKDIIQNNFLTKEDVI